MKQQETDIDIENAVRQRYTAAAAEKEPALCCPVEYEGTYLEVLPQDLIDRDYGCGNPSEYVTSGETVLDLGSGGGKICYILSQVVGPEGRVLGVDQNEEMLALARRYQQQIGERVGWHNTTFFQGNIQDLALDFGAFQAFLAVNPIQNYSDWERANCWAEDQRKMQPMIASNSMDVVVSNCVLNLVDPKYRKQMFSEIFRVLRPGGRAVISDIVSDETVPVHLQNDPALWSGCISGAFAEHKFLEAFEENNFYGVEIVKRQAEAWAIVEGIEFRSLTVRAFKANEKPDLDLHQAVIYHGPWKSVTNEQGHVFERGVRSSVSGKMFDAFSQYPYREQLSLLPAEAKIEESEAQAFGTHTQPPQNIKPSRKRDASLTILPKGGCCEPEDGCC